jgi:hypothetical protein
VSPFSRLHTNSEPLPLPKPAASTAAPAASSNLCGASASEAANAAPGPVDDGFLSLSDLAPQQQHQHQHAGATASAADPPRVLRVSFAPVCQEAKLQQHQQPEQPIINRSVAHRAVSPSPRQRAAASSTPSTTAAAAHAPLRRAHTSPSALPNRGTAPSRVTTSGNLSPRTAVSPMKGFVSPGFLPHEQQQQQQQQQQYASNAASLSSPTRGQSPAPLSVGSRTANPASDMINTRSSHHNASQGPSSGTIRLSAAPPPAAASSFLSENSAEPVVVVPAVGAYIAALAASGSHTGSTSNAATGRSASVTPAAKRYLSHAHRRGSNGGSPPSFAVSMRVSDISRLLAEGRGLAGPESPSFQQQRAASLQLWSDTQHSARRSPRLNYGDGAAISSVPTVGSVGLQDQRRHSREVRFWSGSATATVPGSATRYPASHWQARSGLTRGHTSSPTGDVSSAELSPYPALARLANRRQQSPHSLGGYK